MTADLAIGPFVVRPAERRVYQHGQPVALGARAFDLLLALIERRDRIVGKEELLALVWPGLVVEEGNLSVQVSALRKVLGHRAIATVPGRGYRFTAAVVEQAAAGTPVAAAAAGTAVAPALASETLASHARVAPAAATQAPAITAPTPQTYERLMQRLRDPATKDEPQDSPGAGLSGWLPAAMTPMLGRAAALAETRHLLPSTRCLTLTGAGGSGKTRLALALAESARAQYPGGVWWVALEALSEPGMLAETLARAVGGTNLRQPAEQALAERLAGRKTLLVLDNCEHLVEACADLAARLLRQLPQLHLLNTSRESLRVAGELVWSVPPLDVPAAAEAQPQPLARLEQLAQLAQLAQHASMQLLLERIRQHTPGFALTPDNAASLVQICRGLEGLPLALELVAAQVGLRTPAQVAARLDHSLALLRVGQRGGMPHHQTMAAAVEWGYRLLGAVEQAVFVRLSVFAGGWTLESAAAACAGVGLGVDDLPDTLGRLLRASMVLADAAGAPAAANEADPALRLRMLEPIRQFAFTQLEAQQQVDPTRRRLLAWYAARGKDVAAQLAGPQQAQGYAFLAAEFDNLRALLAWSKSHDSHDGPDIETGIGLATELWRFWQVKGHAKEMLQWFEEALPQAPGLPKALRAAACNSAGVMARTCGQYARAGRLHEESIALQREVGNRKGEASALNNLCVIARDQYDHAAVERHGRACLAIAREIGEKNLEGLALMHLGTALRGQERPADAEASFRESFAIFSALGEKRALGTLHNFLGHLALADGRTAEAEGRFEQSLALNEELGDFWGLGISTCNLAAARLARDDDGGALELLVVSLAHYRRAGVRHGAEECFELLARVAQRRGRPQRAAWCWGVVEQLERDMGKVLSPARNARRERDLRSLAPALPGGQMEAAHAEGLRVPLEDAYAAVLPDGGLA